MNTRLRSLTCLSILLLATSCGRWEPGDFTDPGGNGPGSGGGTSDAGLPDGGDDNSDAGEECPADADGAQARADFAIVEIGLGAEGFIELANVSEFTLDLSDVRLDGSAQGTLGETIEPGGRLLAEAPLGLSGELALTIGGDVLQYVCWGQQPTTQLQNDAVAQGVWAVSACALSPVGGQSLHLTGAGTLTTDWVSRAPTPSSCP